MLVETWLSYWKNRIKAKSRSPQARRKPRSILLSQDWILEDRLVLSSSILGNELLVNSTLVGKQAFEVKNDRSMDVASDGTAIVAWTDSIKGIMGRRVGEDGVPIGAEFPVGGASDTVRGNANVGVYRKVSSGDQERFVVTWTGTDINGSAVFARVFAINGTPLTDPFRVNTSTTGDQKDSAVEWISATRFVIAWSGAGQGETQTVFVRLFDATGTAVTTEIRVPETKTGAKLNPAVAALTNGGFQVAWSGNGPGDASGIFSRQFSGDGVKVGTTEFRVNDIVTGLTHSQPSISASSTQVVIAWQVTDTTGSPYGTGILARRFSTTGKALAARFIVNETTLGNQSDPSIAMMKDGGFVVAWRSVQNGDGIYQREFNPDGTPRFGERQVNSTKDGTQTNPTIRAQGPDGYVVVWDGKIGTVAQGIGMQRYGDPFMPTITSDNKYVNGFNEVLYLKQNVPTDPVIPMKTFTLYNSSNLTIYPILEDANASAAKDKKTGLYDPYDPLNQEYRGYIGYKDPATGKFYLGLRPGETFTFAVPLVFWDAGRMHITTDAQYLITPTGVANPLPNPFKYYDIDPFSNTPTKRFMEDTSIDGSMGRILWYHARAKTSGDAEQIGLDAPTQLTEFTIRDPIMGDTNYKTHDEIATSEKQVLVNYDVSYVDSIVLPVAMETTDVQPFPPQKYEGGINGNVLTLNTDLSNLLFPGMSVTSAAGALPLGTLISSVDAKSIPGKTIVTLSKSANPNPPASSDYFFTHPTPTAAFGWTGAAQRFETLQAAIKQFTLPNAAGKNNNGLGLYFADQNNPNGNGYPQFYNPDSVLSGIKLPSGQNLPGLSPFKAAAGDTGPKSSYNNSRFMITSGGTTDASIPLGGNAGPYAPPQSPEDANEKQLWINFPIGKSLEECQAIAAQLNSGKSDWTITAKLGGDPDITLKGKVTAVGQVFLYAGAYRLVVTLDQANGLDGGVGYGFTFSRTVSDYASTKLANIWYSWAKHYVDAVTKSFGAGYTKNITGTISEDPADKKPTNQLTVAGDLTKTLAPGMVITSQTAMIFPEATADDPNVRVTILELKYDGTSTTIFLSKRPIGRSNGDALNFTVTLPVMLTPADKGVTTFEIDYSKDPKFAKDAAEAEKFGRSVYQLMETMSTIPLFNNQGPDWLQVLTNCIGGNIGFINNIGVSAGDKKYILDKGGFHGIANQIRTLIKSVLRGVSDFNQVPESSGNWYPDPSLTGNKTGQLINTGSGFKIAPYNILNLDPFVWFVHKQLGLSGYGFSLDDDVADVGAPGATKLSLNVGGIDKLPQKAEWTWGTTYGPVNATQGQIATVDGGDFKGNKKIINLGTTVLPPTSDPINVGLLVHGGDPDVGPGALVFGPGIPLGTRVALPIPSENTVILDTKVPPDTTGLVGPFNFRGTVPAVTASVVTNKTTTLRVATDGLYGESNWTFAWSLVDGPDGATVSFTPNKSNAARKSTAFFSASGAYLIRVTITNPVDKSFITSDITVKV